MRKFLFIFLGFISTAVIAENKFIFPKVKNVTMDQISSQYKDDVIQIALSKSPEETKLKLETNRKTVECLFVKVKGDQNKMINFIKKEEYSIFAQVPKLKEMYFNSLKAMRGSVPSWDLNNESCDHIRDLKFRESK